MRYTSFVILWFVGLVINFITYCERAYLFSKWTWADDGRLIPPIAFTSILVLILVMWGVPKLHVHPLTPTGFTEEKEKLQLEDETRKTLAQIVGGLFLAFGLIFTYNSYRQDAEQLSISTRQLKINEEGQVTERFTKAVALLGSGNVEVRLAGLYALERISKDARKAYLENKRASDNSNTGNPNPKQTPANSTGAENATPNQTPANSTGAENANPNQTPANNPDVENANPKQTPANNTGASQNSNTAALKDAKDFKENYWTIMELIASYVRERSKTPAARTGTPAPTGTARKIEADIQAALTILGRRIGLNDRDDPGDSLDLRGAILPGADLSGLNFRDAKFTGANLTGVTLRSTNLSDAVMVDAILSNAHISQTIMAKANLSSAKLNFAVLSSVNLTEATLEETDFSDADLTGALGVEIEQIKKARINTNTKPPKNLVEEWSQILTTSKTSRPSQ